MLWHFHKAPAKKIFFSKDVDSREVADFLMIIEAKKLLRFKVSINPHDIPILRLFGSLNGPSEFLSSHLDDIVLGFGDVNEDLVFGDVFHAVFDEFG